MDRRHHTTAAGHIEARIKQLVRERDRLIEQRDAMLDKKQLREAKRALAQSRKARPAATMVDTSRWDGVFGRLQRTQEAA